MLIFYFSLCSIDVQIFSSSWLTFNEYYEASVSIKMSRLTGNKQRTTIFATHRFKEILLRALKNKRILVLQKQATTMLAQNAGHNRAT